MQNSNLEPIRRPKKKYCCSNLRAVNVFDRFRVLSKPMAPLTFQLSQRSAQVGGSSVVTLKGAVTTFEKQRYNGRSPPFMFGHEQRPSQLTSSQCHAYVDRCMQENCVTPCLLCSGINRSHKQIQRFMFEFRRTLVDLVDCLGFHVLLFTSSLILETSQNLLRVKNLQN